MSQLRSGIVLPVFAAARWACQANPFFDWTVGPLLSISRSALGVYDVTLAIGIPLQARTVQLTAELTAAAPRFVGIEWTSNTAFTVRLFDAAGANADAVAVHLQIWQVGEGQIAGTP